LTTKTITQNADHEHSPGLPFDGPAPPPTFHHSRSPSSNTINPVLIDPEMSSYFFGHEPPPYEDVSHRPSFTPSNARAHHTSSPPFSQRILAESEDQWLHFDDPFNAYIAEPFPSNETNTLDPSLFTSNPIAPIPVFPSHPENNDQFMEKRNVSISPALLDKSTNQTEQVKWYSTGKEVQIGGPPPSVHGGKGKSQQGGKGKIHEEVQRDDITEGSGQVKGKGKKKARVNPLFKALGKEKEKGKATVNSLSQAGKVREWGKKKARLDALPKASGKEKEKEKATVNSLSKAAKVRDWGKEKATVKPLSKAMAKAREKESARSQNCYKRQPSNPYRRALLPQSLTPPPSTNAKYSKRPFQQVSPTSRALK